jgi:hypothetical protein
MHSIDEQPVTEGKTPPEPKRFEVHLKSNGTLANVFNVDCHDFREVGRYLQFDDEKGNPVAVFPADQLVAAIRVPNLVIEYQKQQAVKTEQLDVTMSNGVEIRDLGLRVHE